MARKKKDIKPDFFQKPGEKDMRADDFIAAHREPWEQKETQTDVNEPEVLIAAAVPVKLRKRLRAAAYMRECKIKDIVRIALERELENIE